MTRLQMRHQDGAPFTGLGLAGLAVGLLAGLATGAYLAHRLGGSGRVAELVRRTRTRAGSVARELEAEAGEIDTLDLEDEDQDYAADDILDDESGDDWDDEIDEDDGDAYDDDDAFSSADPDLEERVLEAFTNDPILSERAVDIGAIRASTIELIGTVFSDEEHDYATTLTGGVPGVEKVVNRLVVREPTEAKGTARRGSSPGERATGGRIDDQRTAATDTQESRPPESPPAP